MEERLRESSTWLRVKDGELVLHLSGIEKVEGAHGDLRVPVAGLLRLPTLLVIILIGVQACILSQLGLRLGARVSTEVHEGAERLAGLALTALGVGLLIEKIASG